MSSTTTTRALIRGASGAIVVAAGFTFAVGTAAATPATVDEVVGGCSGAPASTATATTIQAAVDAAPSGGTIYVCPGNYPEAVNVNKLLTILGPQNGVDASNPATRTDPSAEAVVTGSGASPFTYATGVGGTLDGLTLTGATTGSDAGIDALAGAGTDSYHWDNDIIEGNVEGINFTTGPSAAPSTIEQDRFVDDNQDPSDATSGTGIFLTQGPSIDLTISHNSFSGDYGAGNGVINTTGAGSCAPPSTTGMSTGLVISDNTATIAANQANNFLVLFCTDHAQVTGNQVNADPSDGDTVLYLGGGDQYLTLSSNTLSGGSGGAGISMNSDFYDAGTGNVLSDNTITGHSNGIVVRGARENNHAGYSGFTISGNNVSSSVSDGITVYAGQTGGVVTGNTATGSGVYDCQDASTGSGTAGTANTWASDNGATSSPAGLCSSPTAALPESPIGVALPVAALGLGALGFTVVRRRRRTA